MSEPARALTYIEIDVPHCALSYGVAPCTAAIPTTGTIKCFNGLGTCQDRANFSDTPVTLRFAKSTDYLPSDIAAIPSIRDVSFTPGTVSLGQDLGQRATVKASFIDHPNSDAGDTYDKYPADRDYADPYARGTYWGKFRARNPFLRRRALRLIRGFVGQALAAMETRHYVVDSIDGPTPAGVFTIVAKDVLKLASGDRAQAPVLSNGFLVADITDVDTSLTLSPSAIGDDEYPVSGDAALGGKEIVAFERDQYTKLLLHGGGADAATTITDSSPIHRTVTANGAAQIDTGQSVFGGSSIQLGAAGNKLTIAASADFNFGANPFQLDIRVRFSSLTGGAPTAPSSLVGTEVIWKHESALDPSWYLILSGTAIRFIVINAASTIIGYYTATHGMVINTWYRLTLARTGSALILYKDQVAYTWTITTNLGAAAMPSPTGIMQIGGTSAPGPGWVDEARVLKGLSPSVVAESVAFDLIASGDVLYLARAQFNTPAVAHKAQDRVQLCLVYTAQDPADIIADLLESYAGVESDLIPLTSWQTETAASLGTLYTACIAEPTGVDVLCSELIEQAALAVWWDDISQLIRLQVLRAIATTADLFDEEVWMAGTLDPKEQPEKRISQVITYFGQINPLLKLDQLENYRSTAGLIDAQSEADNGSSAIKKIYSRWIPTGGRTVADRLNAIQIARFVVPPRRFTFELMRQPDGSLAPQMGGGYQLASWAFQDETGDRTEVPIQLTRVNPGDATFQIEAEEMLFQALDSDPTERPIILDSNINDINLRTLHDLLYPTPESGDTITCTVLEGVIVGSSSTSTPALDIGTWPAGVTVALVVLGRIQGKGGDGGTGYGGTGRAGGSALYTRQAISLNNTAGEIWGGGGGGGATLNGGGGGAGQQPGRGGGNTAGIGGFGGDDGTTEAGGVAGAATGGFPAGGNGGGPGLAGTPSTGGGGAAGSAIDGVSHCTITGAGDRRGSEIN